jgi:glycine betaine/choline ABC-type transport system substrate-binding protein
MRSRRPLRLAATTAALALALAACNGDADDTDVDPDGEATGDEATEEAPETLTFAGPPECEERSTCYQGLVDVYGLDGLEFQSVQEASARIAALDAGDVELILMFSTDAILGEEGLTVLDDPEDIVPPENIVPVLNDDVIDTYGEDVTDVLDQVTSTLTTEVLIDLNMRAGEGQAPDQIASDWLDESGFATDVSAEDGDLEIVVASFNFPESVILAEIYAQVLEDAGYPVDRQLDLGAREIIFPELADGSLHLLPEYLGSALTVGFGEDAPGDVDEGRDALQEAFAEDGVTVLEPAPAENANVFVTTTELAETYGWSSVADLG